MEPRRRIRFDGQVWTFEGDEGVEATRAHIPDVEPHMVAFAASLASEIDTDALLHDGSATIYVDDDDDEPLNGARPARDHITLTLRNDTLTIALLDGSWLAMPACELFEDLNASLPDHAKRALDSVNDAEAELATLDDNLLYPPFRQKHERELEQLFERRRALPAFIARRLAHWEDVERGGRQRRAWHTRRRGDPVVREHLFAQLGESRVVVRSERRWMVRGYGFGPVWVTEDALVVDGRELTIVDGGRLLDNLGSSGHVGEHLGDRRYRVRAAGATKTVELVFDLAAMTVAPGGDG